MAEPLYQSTDTQGHGERFKTGHADVDPGFTRVAVHGGVLHPAITAVDRHVAPAALGNVSRQPDAKHFPANRAGLDDAVLILVHVTRLVRAEHRFQEAAGGLVLDVAVL